MTSENNIKIHRLDTSKTTSNASLDDQEATSSVPDDGRFLIHDGALVKQMPVFPQVGTNTLASGWTTAKVEGLKSAIEELVVQNPILSGIVVLQKDAIYIEPGHYKPGSSSTLRSPFWTEIVPEKQLDNITSWQQDNAPAMAKIDFMEEHISPLLPTLKTVEEEAKAKSPVFQVHFMRLPNDHLFYSVRISHAVGDAATYYEILNQLSLLMTTTKQKGEEAAAGDLPQKINWEAPAQKGAQEFFLDHMSPRDVSRTYSTPFIVGILPNLILGTNRYSYLLLSRDKINKKKQGLKSPDEKYLTTNDIVVAALCQSNHRLELLTQFTNVRGKKDGVKELDGGNFIQEYLFPRQAATDPNQVRKITREAKYFETDQVPIRPMLFNRMGRISNWASVSRCLELEGTRSVAEVAPEGFVKDVPYEFAVIFSIDEAHIGVLHNYKAIDTSGGLLQELLAN